MKNEVEQVLSQWAEIAIRKPEAIENLKRVYQLITGKTMATGCGGCITKAFNECRKYYHKTYESMAKQTDKKYILKPGKHQFIPGSPTLYDNDTLSDEQAEWWLEKMPHLKQHFEKVPSKKKEQKIEPEKSVDQTED